MLEAIKKKILAIAEEHDLERLKVDFEDKLDYAFDGEDESPFYTPTFHHLLIHEKCERSPEEEGEDTPAKTIKELTEQLRVAKHDAASARKEADGMSLSIVGMQLSEQYIKPLMKPIDVKELVAAYQFLADQGPEAQAIADGIATYLDRNYVFRTRKDTK